MDGFYVIQSTGNRDAHEAMRIIEGLKVKPYMSTRDSGYMDTSPGYITHTYIYIYVCVHYYIYWHTHTQKVSHTHLCIITHRQTHTCMHTHRYMKMRVNEYSNIHSWSWIRNVSYLRTQHRFAWWQLLSKFSDTVSDICSFVLLIFPHTFQIHFLSYTFPRFSSLPLSHFPSSFLPSILSSSFSIFFSSFLLFLEEGAQCQSRIVVWWMTG